MSENETLFPKIIGREGVTYEEVKDTVLAVKFWTSKANDCISADHLQKKYPQVRLSDDPGKYKHRQNNIE